jgi:hypothetical protein
MPLHSHSIRKHHEGKRPGLRSGHSAPDQWFIVHDERFTHSFSRLNSGYAYDICLNISQPSLSRNVTSARSCP